MKRDEELCPECGGALDDNEECQNRECKTWRPREEWMSQWDV